MTGTPEAGVGAPPADGWDETRARVARELGIGEPLPTPVLRRMLQEPAFAREVVVARSSPDFLRVLFSHPRTRAYADAAADGAAPGDAGSGAGGGAAVRHSNGELLRNAAGALLRWGKAGFARVDAATFERRWSACQSCPNLADAPGDRLLYRVKMASDADPRVCNACGCVASRKARLPGESCPAADPADPSLTRWGEPRRAAAF